MSEKPSNYPVKPSIAQLKEKEMLSKPNKGQVSHSEHAGKLNLGQENINAKLEVSRGKISAFTSPRALSLVPALTSGGHVGCM